MIAGVLCAIAAHIVLGLFGAAFGFAAAPAGIAYADERGMVTTRPPDVVERTDDPTMHH